MSGQQTRTVARRFLWAQGLFVTWLAAITVVYFVTVARGVLHPPNVGNERVWAAGWILFGVSFAVLRFLVRRAALIAVGSMALAATVFVLASGRLIALLAAATLACASYVLGSVMTRLRGGEEPVVSFAAGLAAIALLTFIVSAVHLLSAPLFWILSLAVCGVGWKKLQPLAGRIFASIRHIGVSDAAERDILLVLSAAFGLLNLTWAVAPEVRYDALNYHLAVPAAHLRAGGLIELPNYYHSHFYGAVESIWAAAMAMGGQNAAKLLNLFFVVLTAMGVAAVTSRLFGPRAAVWAAALYFTVPLIGWNTATADVEPGLSLFLIGFVLVFLRWLDERSVRWLLIAGLVIGVAVAVKIVALLALPVPVLMIAIALLRKGAPGVLRLAVLAMVAAISAAPWYLLRYGYTGNPLYPFYGSLFGTTPAPPHIENVFEPFRTELSLRAVSTLPWRFTFGTLVFNESGIPDGGAGVLLLIAFPAALLLFRRSAAISGIVATALLHVVLWAYLFTYARYFAPVLPLLAVLAGGALALFLRSAPRLAPLFVSALVVAQGALIPAQYWELPDRYPLRHAAGLERDGELLRRAHPLYAATAMLNDPRRAGEKVLTRGFERIRYYVHPEMSSWLMTLEFHRLLAGKSDAEIHALLWRNGYRLFAIDRNWPPGGPYDTPEFPQSRARLLLDAGSAQVYELRDPQIANAPP